MQVLVNLCEESPISSPGVSAPGLLGEEPDEKKKKKNKNKKKFIQLMTDVVSASAEVTSSCASASLTVSSVAIGDLTSSCELVHVIHVHMQWNLSVVDTTGPKKWCPN